jgi:hypothetical protein
LAFTYDVTTSRGRVRLLIADTDSSNVLYQDDEVDAFLALAQSNVYLGAALAIESLLSEKGVRLAKRVKRGHYETEEHGIADLLALSKRFRDDAVGSGSVGVGRIALSGEHLASHQPEWIPDDETGIGR